MAAGKLLILSIVYLLLLQMLIFSCYFGSAQQHHYHHYHHRRYLHGKKSSTHYGARAPPRLLKNIYTTTTAQAVNDTDSNGVNYMLVNVQQFGAIGDGVSDDTKAFVKAWEAACKSWSSPILYVPRDLEFLLHPIIFQGPCSGPVSFQVDGNITAPKILKEWSSQDKYWIQFKNMDTFVMNGSGLLNGQGQRWWSCVREKTKNCPSRSPPSLLKISNSIDVTVQDLKLIHSQKMHVVFDSCQGVRASNLRIVSPASSPNTDGIHLERSTNVQIQNCTVATGDDCISIGNGTSHVEIKDISCGPGHGISIGSLGRKHTKAEVSHIVVDGAILKSTRYGARIKTWQGGSGFARFITFQNIIMDEVRKPILINQYYCTRQDDPCHNATSAVEVNAILYKNITGTSRTRNAIQFDCSETIPCHHIVLEDINLTYGFEGNVQATCVSASGLAFGRVEPPSCLTLQP